MRRATVLTVLCLVVAAGASAHRGAPGWDEASAERVVEREAAVRVPRAERLALRAELGPLIADLRMLEQVAWTEGDELTGVRAHNLRYRSSTALKKSEDGLRVVEAECDASDSSGRSSSHFRCTVVSEPLIVPIAALVYDDGSALPRIVEGAPVVRGPYAAVLVVHTRAGGSFSFQQRRASTRVVTRAGGPASTAQPRGRGAPNPRSSGHALGSVTSLTLAASRARTTRARAAPTLRTCWIRRERSRS